MDRTRKEPDNDTLRTGSASDIAYGGDGDDSLIGGAGNDTLIAGSGIDTLSGGAGDDYLDGGAGNDNVEGGGGADVLMGGAGNDSMAGGADRHLLVGGLGSDTLIGNAADDVLIAGTTGYDADATALRSILNVWNGSGTYAERVSILQSNSYQHKLVANVTVHDDGAVDRLTGSAGQDWFFANVSGTGVLDQITDLGGNENGPDLNPYIRRMLKAAQRDDVAMRRCIVVVVSSGA